MSSRSNASLILRIVGAALSVSISGLTAAPLYAAESAGVSTQPASTQPADIRPTDTRPAATGPASLDVQNLKLVKLMGDPRFRHAAYVTNIAVIDGGKQLLTSAMDGTARIWDAATGKETARFLADTDRHVYSALMLPGGKSLVTGGGNHQVTLWSVETGKPLRDMKHDAAATILSMAMTADGKELFAADTSGKVIQWNLETGAKIRELTGHSGGVYGLALAPDGKTLATGGADHAIRLWDTDSGESIRTISKHASTVHAVAFLPHGDKLVSVSADKTLRLWNMAGEELWNVPLPAYGRTVAVSPDGAMLAVPCTDHLLHLLSAKDGKELRAIPMAGQVHQAVAFSADGTEVYGAAGSLIGRWNSSNGERLFPSAEAGTNLVVGAMNRLALAPDGRRLYSAGEGNNVYVWNLQRQELEDLWDQGGWVDALELTRDGRKLLAAHSYGQAKLLDSATGKTVGEWRAPARNWRLCDGDKCLAAISEGQLHLWYVRSPTSGPLLEVQNSLINLMASSRDGQLLLAERHGLISIWSVESGSEVGRVGTEDPTGAHDIQAAVFLPDGTGMLTGCEPHLLRHWTRGSDGSKTPLSEKELIRWVQNLGSQESSVQEQAVATLVDAGPSVLPWLAKADLGNPEVVERLRKVRGGLQKYLAPNHLVGEPLDLKFYLTEIAVHPGGRYWGAIVRLDAASQIVLGDLTPQGPRELKRIDDGSSPGSLLFSADGTLYAGNRNGTISVYAAGERQP